MIGYDPSYLNETETLLEEFHKIQKYLFENPIYKIYQANVDYVTGVNEYYITDVTTRSGDTLGVGDVILFRNVFYGVITEINEDTQMFTIAEGISFRGATGATGANGANGARGPRGETGATGANGLSIYLYDGEITSTTTTATTAQVEVPTGRTLQVFDILFSTYETTFGAMAEVTEIHDTGLRVDYIGRVVGAQGPSGDIDAVTGQVTVNSSDWVAGDAFGAYRAIITLPTQIDYDDTVLLSRTTVNDPHITFAGKWSTDTPTVRISALKAERVTFTWTVIPASATGATQGAVIVSATSQDEILKVDWATLKDMRDNGKLAQGKQYRITDYVATTTQGNTQSAGHPFDIIVVADSPNTLNENARAVAHEGDTYFANCKLSAWEIKYCLDNDKTRFEWAQTYTPASNAWFTSGYDSGVWYATGDTYVHEGVTYYVFYNEAANSTLYSAVPAPTTANSNEVYVDFKGGGTLEDDGSPIVSYGDGSEKAEGKGVIYYMKDEYGNECPYDFKNIMYLASDASYVYTFGGTSDDSLSGNTQSNIIRTYGETPQELPYNTFGVNCSYNTLGSNCFYNTLGESCSQNTFGEGCTSNTFGNNFSSNTVGDNCNDNITGINCYNNTFGNSCLRNTIDNGCANNIFDHVVYGITLHPVGASYVHIHSGVRNKTITVTPNANYVQDVRTANDVTITV